MTQTLAHFTGSDARRQFPGAVFVLAAALAALTLIVVLIQVRRMSRRAERRSCLAPFKEARKMTVHCSSPRHAR